MGHRHRVGHRVERALDLPGGTVSKAMLLEMEGNHRAVITGCSGIVTYTEDCISLRIPEGMLHLYGTDLEMGCLTADGTVVTGTIRRMELDNG